MDQKIAREELRKVIEKYKLPDLETLNKELEIVDMLTEKREISQNILSGIRRRFTEFVYSWINFLHSLVVPNPQSLIMNKDAEAFGEKEKDHIYELITILAKITRESTGFEIEKGQEKNEAKFIIDNFPKYLEIKKELKEINEKLVEHWQKEISLQK